MPPPPELAMQDSGTFVTVPIPGFIVLGGTFSTVVWIANKWIRASCSFEALDKRLESIQKLINVNSSYAQDLLLEAGPGFKSDLREIYLKSENIKTNQYREPAGIANIPARILFRYHQAQGIRSCHCQLRQLEHAVKARAQAMREARALASYELMPSQPRVQNY